MVNCLGDGSSNPKFYDLFLVDMAESEQGNRKVLIVAERYSTTSGGFIDSLRAALKDLPAADGASKPTTYVTSVERTRDRPDETEAEIRDLNIEIIEPDRKLKYEPSRELLTNYYRDFFSRQITSISGIQVVVGTEPFTSLTASCLRDELTETYNISHGFSKSWKSSSSSSSRSSCSSQSRSSSKSSKNSPSSGSSSHGTCDSDNDGRPKLVMVNYMEGENSFDDNDESLPGTSELEFIENARDSDVVISVGLRVYRHWQDILHPENIVHESFIPFESILSEDHPRRNVPDDVTIKAIKRVLTLNTGCYDILQSDFHRRVAGILGSLAKMKAETEETNFLTWIVHVGGDLTDEKKREIRSTLTQWAKCKALKIQLICPKKKSELEHQVVISSLVLMPGMFTVTGYSGLECMIASIPCLVPEDSDVGAVIRFEDKLNTAFLMPPLCFTENVENEWKRKILNVLINNADACRHARDLSMKLKSSALYESSKKLLPQIIYGMIFYLKNSVKYIHFHALLVLLQKKIKKSNE